MNMPIANKRMTKDRRFFETFKRGQDADAHPVFHIKITTNMASLEAWQPVMIYLGER